MKLCISEKVLLIGIKGKYAHSKKRSIGFVTIEKGALMLAYSHLHKQINQVVSGKLEIIISSPTQILELDSIIGTPKHDAKC